MNMQEDNTGLEFTENEEGLRLVGYLDATGTPTAGWGHTGSDVQVGVVYTRDQCIIWLQHDCLASVLAVNRLVHVPLTQNQFDALVDFVFNCGAGNFANSTLLRLLNEGNYQGAHDEFVKWDKSKGIVLSGLLKRRQGEAAMFGNSAPPVFSAPTTAIPETVAPTEPTTIPQRNVSNSLNWLIGGIDNVVQGILHNLST